VKLALGTFLQSQLHSVRRDGSLPESSTRIPPLVLVLALFDPNIPPIPLGSTACLDLLADSSQILHIASRDNPIPQHNFMLSYCHIRWSALIV